MKSAPFITILAALGTIGAVAPASAAWVRLPNQEVRPVNLATENISKTGIESSKGIGQAANLIDEDPTKVATLSAGQSSATIRLNSQQYVDSIILSNGGAEGVVTLSGSTDKNHWQALTQVSFSSSDVAVTASFASSQARYLRLDFNTSSPGAITNVVITGSAASAAAVSDRSSGQANLASAIGGARAIYASPTPSNLGDREFLVNVIRFPQSNQSGQTLIYELSSNSPVSDISLAYDRRPTRVDVFAFDELPEKKDWRGKSTLDPAFLDGAAPAASGVDARGLGRIKVKPASALSAQYLVVRLQPLQGNAFNPWGSSGGRMVASTPPGGSTIGSLLINGAFSTLAFNQAASHALGSGGSTPGAQNPGDSDTPGTQTPGSLDTAMTLLYPFGALGSDYRAANGVGLGNSGQTSDDDGPPQVVNNTIVRPGRPVSVVAPPSDTNVSNTDP
jgi:hypothetical protein